MIVESNEMKHVFSFSESPIVLVSGNVEIGNWESSWDEDDLFHPPVSFKLVDHDQ